MKQKLALCCALIHNPGILVLDEPTTGVDAVSRKEFWDTLHALKLSGMTILVSTPYMDEAARCDRIALMQTGKIMAENTPAAMLNNFKTRLYEIRTSDRFKTLNVLRSVRDVSRSYLFGQGIHIAMHSESDGRERLLKSLEKEGITGVEIYAVKADFEDCFIEAVETNQSNA
jgi:ABC-type multidrug transport system ATPase subunit